MTLFMISPMTPPMTSSMTTILAFDFGTVNTGVATGNGISRTASPIATLAMRDGRPRWRELRALVEEWRPDRLVVGLPLNMDGTETTVAPQAKDFARELERRYGLPVTLVDERLTSVAAAERVAATDPRSHAVAAAIIAEQFLSTTP